MLHAVDKIPNIEFFLKPQVQPLCLVLKLNIDINFTFQNSVQNRVYSLKMAGFHSLLQPNLAIHDHLVALFAPTDHFFLEIALDVFVNSIPQAAALAVKLVAFLTIILSVLECKLAFAALVAMAVRLVSALLYHLFDLWIGSQVHRFMATVIRNVEINTCGHE